MKKIITLPLFIILLFLISCDNKEKKEVQKIENITTVSDGQKEILEKETIEIIKIVNAKSGLRYRDAPKGKTISKFKYNTKVTIVEKTGITDEFTDNNELITGEWVGVKLGDKKIVYVFDGFLSEFKEKPVIPVLKNPIDEALLDGYIIKPGQYHANEIPDEISFQDWLGIFKENDTYNITKTSVNITKTYDESVDTKGDKTGKKIAANSAKECYLLMNNIPYLSEGAITTVTTKPMAIHPDAPYTFQFNNIEYTLSATAKTYEPLKLNVNYFKAEGYKLYLETTKEGVKTKQLLVYERFFNRQMIEVLFIGDIDGDTVPDLLINSATHYNKFVPTLYLSKEAKKEAILKIVSLHISTGS